MIHLHEKLRYGYLGIEEVIAMSEEEVVEITVEEFGIGTGIWYWNWALELSTGIEYWNWVLELGTGIGTGMGTGIVYWN